MSHEKKSADVIVVGGGIIGCAIAYRLAQEALSICVLEAREPGAEASRAAAGMLTAQVEAERDDEFLKLCLAGRSLHAKLAEQLKSDVGMDIEYRASGLLFVAFNEAEVAELQQRWQWQKRAGLHVEALNGHAARAHEPLLSPEVEFALLFPDDAQVDNVRLTNALYRAAVARGVCFLKGRPAQKIVAPERGVCTVVAGGEAYTAPWVIDAAGAWSATIDHKLSYPLPVKPFRGQMVALQSSRTLFQRPIFSRRGYLVPRADGRLLVGSTMEQVGYDKSVTAEGLRRLLEGAAILAPETRALAFVEAWAGLRPCTDDHRPLIGCTEMPGLLLATGHGRNGILLAPVTAEIIRDLVITGHPSLFIESMNPARFHAETR